MKTYKDLVNEDLYDDNKEFSKAYDKWHEATSVLSRVIRKERKKSSQKFNTLIDDIEVLIDKME